MRSGHCSPCTDEKRGPSHGRCRMPDCSSGCHLLDTREAAEALTEPKWHTPPAFEEMVAHEKLLPTVDPPQQSELELALGWFLAACERLSKAPSADLSPEDSLKVLYLLRRGIDQARDMDAALVRHVYLAGEHGDVRIDGIPPAKVVRRKDRKNWDARGAAFAYVDSQMLAREGEPADPAEVAAWVLDLIGASYVRVTPLRAVGLDPQEFCDETPGALSVTFLD